jgi:acyl-CoA hydrolase
MENFKLVLPEHLNHYGYLFDGYLLQWVDETAWICASLEYPSCRFITVGMDDVEFRKSVRQGAILRFDVVRGKVGNTSVQYSVQVPKLITRSRGVSSAGFVRRIVRPKPLQSAKKRMNGRLTASSAASAGGA